MDNSREGSSHGYTLVVCRALVVDEQPAKRPERIAEGSGGKPRAWTNRDQSRRREIQSPSECRQAAENVQPHLDSCREFASGGRTPEHDNASVTRDDRLFGRFPKFIDMAPATRPATPARRVSLFAASAAATPGTKLAVKMMGWLAASIALLVGLRNSL